MASKVSAARARLRVTEGPQLVPSSAANATSLTSAEIIPYEQKDYFVERNGLKFAGTHLLIELWQASNLDDVGAIDAALREAAVTAGATVLHSHFHHFSPNGGVSGVVVLAESHISIHTWPEKGYAALDIFMCGSCDPYKSIPVLKTVFAPGGLQIAEHKRGLLG
jgi:S-adenosylmethionine decarboxylase